MQCFTLRRLFLMIYLSQKLCINYWTERFADHLWIVWQKNICSTLDYEPQYKYSTDMYQYSRPVSLYLAENLTTHDSGWAVLRLSIDSLDFVVPSQYIKKPITDGGPFGPIIYTCLNRLKIDVDYFFFRSICSLLSNIISNDSVLLFSVILFLTLISWRCIVALDLCVFNLGGIIIKDW